MVWKITSVNVPSDNTMKSRKQVKPKTNEEIPEDFTSQTGREYNHNKVQDVLREDASSRGFTYDGPYDPPKGDRFTREAWPKYDPPVDKDCCCVTKSDVLFLLFSIVFVAGIFATGYTIVLDHPVKIVPHKVFNDINGQYTTHYHQEVQNLEWLIPGLIGIIVGGFGLFFTWMGKED